MGIRLPASRWAVVTLAALAAAPAWAEYRALLVGVSNYPSLEKMQLAGPANDVKLMRELLAGKGFAADNIQVLADGVSNAGDPTRKNILAAFDKLATQANAGDFIYLHFGGHGSQQPTRADKTPPEPDGMDEIFLPRDIGKWNGKAGAVDNALVDTELNQAITRLRDKGAFVWAVFDACHSGTMTRGVASDDVVYRKVPADALGIPQEALAPKEQMRGAPPAKAPLGAVADAGKGKGGLVAFYAAQTVETTPEMRLPAGGQRHGLFSYTLAETLSRYPGITYRQLGQQVLQRYAALNMHTPTPLFEGTALDAPVFDQADVAGGPNQWPLKVDAAGAMSIGAGSLHRFSTGAIFAVVPTPASSDKEIIGFMRADKVDNLTSTLVGVAHAGKPAPASGVLKPGQYLRLVDAKLRLSLRVALPPSKADKPPTPAEKSAHQLVAGLRAKARDGIQIDWVESGQQADINLLIADNKLWLLPPDGKWEKDGPSKTHSIDLVANKTGVAEKLTQSFQAIAKVSNLLRVASTLGSADGATAKGLEVTATIIRRGARAPLDVASLPQMQDGDELEFVFKNKGRTMLDITALFVDSEFGIEAMYPQRGYSNRIEVGASDRITLALNATTLGTERLVIIAVPAEPQTAWADFSFLEQKALERTRGVGDLRGPPADLDAIFQEAGFGAQPATRGAGLKATALDAGFLMYGWKIGK